MNHKWPEWDEFIAENKRLVICPLRYYTDIRRMVPTYWEVIANEHVEDQVYIIKPPDFLEQLQSVFPEPERTVQFHWPLLVVDINDPARALKGINGLL